MVRYHVDAHSIPKVLVKPVARCLTILPHLHGAHPSLSDLRRCGHLANGSEHLKIWVTTSEDGRGYFSCGGCAMKRVSFREVCDECKEPLTDDGHEVFTAYVDEDCSAVASLCGPCSDIYGETALLKTDEVLSLYKEMM